MVALDVDERLAEGDEVLGAGGPDAVFGELVAFGGGGPVNEVAAGFLFVDRLGRPGAAGVVGRDLDEARLRPVHEIGGLPHDDGAAAGGGGAFPAGLPADRKVGGDEVGFG